MKYEPIKEYTDKEIMDILYHGSDTELKILPLSVGEFHINCQFAQDVCFLLMENSDEDIRANAILGLSYIARRYNKLDTKKMKLLLTKQQTFSKRNLERVKYALEDISLFLSENIEL